MEKIGPPSTEQLFCGLQEEPGDQVAFSFGLILSAAARLSLGEGPHRM